MSLMSSIKSRASNPVIDTEMAARIAAGSIGHFDIHESIQDIYAGANPRFVSDAFSGLVWFLDNQMIVQNTKAIVLQLPATDGKITIDTESELRNALEEMWASELHAYDNGLEGNGKLHLVACALNIRQAWIDNAQVAHTAQNRFYPVQSLSTVIGMPKKQVIDSNYIANTSVDALNQFGLISDQPARLQFQHGVNWLREVDEIRQRIARDNALLPAEDQQGLVEADVRYQELVKNLSNVSEAVSNALEYFELAIAQRQTTLNSWYQRDLDRIPLMMKVIDFCEHKMLVDHEDLMSFDNLPAALQVGACNSAINTLTRTCSNFRDKPVYMYTAFKQLTASAVTLLNRVIKLQLDD